MYKRLFLLVLISAIITSCGNSGKKEASVKSEESGNTSKVEFAALVANPDNYVGKNITIEGKVVHVCTETGKKMFIVGENPDIRLFVAAGENISKFPMELLGSQVSVEGTITKRGEIAKAVPTEGVEGMQTKGMTDMAADSCETEKALSSQTSMSDIIMEYRSHSVK
jgi:hypothetical protein